MQERFGLEARCSGPMYLGPLHDESFLLDMAQQALQLGWISDAEWSACAGVAGV